MAAADNDGKTIPPKYTGFQHVSGATRDHVATMAASRGFAEPRILVHWSEIVGQTLAARCRPLHVRYGKGLQLGATLVVEADGPVAVTVEHESPRILERVNQFYGYRAVTRLRVTQTGVGAWKAAAPANEPAPIPETVRNRAEQMAARAETPALRKALSEMGAHVLAYRDRAGDET